MKTSRLFATLALAMTIGLQAYAEDKVQTLSSVIVTNDSVTIPESTPKAEKKFGSKGVQQLEYLAIEDGFGFSLSSQEDGIVHGIEAWWGKTNDVLTRNWAWNIFIGWQDRYFLFKNFFVEGKIVIKWENYKSKMKMPAYDKDGNETYKEESIYNDYLGLVVSPRVGLKFCKKFAITAGYRWDFNKFKFKKKDTMDFFTVGVDYAF